MNKSVANVSFNTGDTETDRVFSFIYSRVVYDRAGFKSWLDLVMVIGETAYENSNVPVTSDLEYWVGKGIYKRFIRVLRAKGLLPEFRRSVSFDVYG